MDDNTNNRRDYMDYSNDDVRLAKEYLKTRLRAERSSSRNLNIYLMLAIEEIIRLCKEYNIDIQNMNDSYNFMFNSRLNQLIRKFKDRLYDMVEDLCVYANEDDKKNIILFINKERYGMTLESRISQYVDQLPQQIADIASKDIIKSVIAFGIGSKLDVLLRHTISLAYMDEWKSMHPNAKGFYSFRGSSYPCQTCDDYTGYHPMEEYALPLHPNCCCYAVFTN